MFDAIDSLIGPIDAFIEPIDALIKPIDAFIKRIDALVKRINGLVRAIDAFIDRVDGTGIRVLVAARRQGRGSRNLSEASIKPLKGKDMKERWSCRSERDSRE